MKVVIKSTATHKNELLNSSGSLTYFGVELHYKQLCDILESSKNITATSNPVKMIKNMTKLTIDGYAVLMC